MSDNEPGEEELYRTPSLDEFLVDEGETAMRKIYQSKGKESDYLEKQKKRFKQVDEARKALAEGDSGPGIAILKEAVNELKRNVSFNDENGRNDETVKGMRTMLSLYQILLHDLENPVEYGQ